jgi:predicted RNA binding protein YcfA (HicA-like mRNA interferase family)
MGVSRQFYRPQDFDGYLEMFLELNLIQRDSDPNLPQDFERIQLELQDLMHDKNSEEEIEQLENWLELSVDDHEDWASGGSSVYETLAWYQPITFSQQDAGIFLTLRGLRLFASRNLRALRELGLPKRELVRAAWFGAFSQLLAHEIFHHQIEWMSFRFDTNLDLIGSPTMARSQTRLPRYVDYTHNVYRPSLKQSPDGALEEALASASEYVQFPNSFKLGNDSFPYSPEVRRVIRKRISDGYGSRPLGYREAPRYLDSFRFRHGVSNLLAQVFNPTLVAAPQVVLPRLGIQSSELKTHFLSNFTIVVESGDASLRDFPMSLVVPDIKLKKLLQAEGFHPTNLGKGSHEVWKRPGSPMITVPNRKDQAGIKFLKSAAKSLGYENLRDLQEAARSV